MKDTQMKKTIWGLAVVGVLAGSSAMAQVYSAAEGDSSFKIQRGYISATTPVSDVAVLKGNDVYVNFKCGVAGATATSLSIIRKLADGTVLDTSSAQLCDTTPRTVSYTAPQWFGKIAVSATTAVSTSAGGGSITIIQTKK